jgi:hypothetical protein
MFKTIALMALMLSTSAMANVIFPFDPLCGFAYRYESYALGIDKAYRQNNKQPIKLDQLCFELGEQIGALLLKHEDSSDCQRAYKIGLSQGLKGVSYGPIETPSECYNPSVPVGLTLLSVQARAEFKAGQNSVCGKAYGKGREDGLNNRVQTITGDNFRDHCYITGHSDAQIYGNL